MCILNHLKELGTQHYMRTHYKRPGQMLNKEEPQKTD